MCINLRTSSKYMLWGSEPRKHKCVALDPGNVLAQKGGQRIRTGIEERKKEEIYEKGKNLQRGLAG